MGWDGIGLTPLKTVPSRPGVGSIYSYKVSIIDFGFKKSLFNSIKRRRNNNINIIIGNNLRNNNIKEKAYEPKIK